MTARRLDPACPLILVLAMVATNPGFAGPAPQVGGLVGGFGRAAAAMTGGVPLRDQNDPRNGVRGAAACGPTALAMALASFGKDIPTAQLIEESGMDPATGATIGELVDLANKYLPESHFSWGIAFGRDPMTYLRGKLADGALVIVPVQGEYAGKTAPEGHYLLVTSIANGMVHANDPAGGTRVSLSESEFTGIWRPTGDGKKPCVVVRGN